MPPQLLALNEGPSIMLDKPILLIGRHQECDVQIPSRKISRRHCCIAQVNDHLAVRDLCSTNGIRINGIRVLEGDLKAGDELTIGNMRYEVRMSLQAGGAPPAKKEPVKVTAMPRNGDPLESCEEPVPLPEPLPLNGVGAGFIDPVPLDGQAPPGPVPPVVLPDNLEMARSKDFPIIPQQQPPPAAGA